MATPWASKRTPKLLKSAYMADQEFLLEETRASRLLYFPGPVAWIVVFTILAYFSWAPTAKLPGLSYFTDGVGWLASVLRQDAGTFRLVLTVLFLLFVVAGVLWLTVRFLRWMRTVYAVTNRRVLIQSGILRRDFDEIPVTQVRGVDVSQSFLQRILGYGTVRLSSEGGTSHLGHEDWEGIPKPFRFQKLIEEATVAIQTGGGPTPTTTGVK